MLVASGWRHGDLYHEGARAKHEKLQILTATMEPQERSGGSAFGSEIQV